MGFGAFYLGIFQATAQFAKQSFGSFQVLGRSNRQPFIGCHWVRIDAFAQHQHAAQKQLRLSVPFARGFFKQRKRAHEIPIYALTTVIKSGKAMRGERVAVRGCGLEKFGSALQSLIQKFLHNIKFLPADE